MRDPRFRHATARAAIVALLLSAFPLATSAGASDVEELAPIHTPPSAAADDGVMYDESSDLWFVELSSRPGVEGTPARQLEREQANFRAAARREGVSFEERAAFRSLWNGLSVRVRPDALGDLQRLPGVAAIYPVATVQIPEPGTADPDMGTALAMTGADIARSELGLTGEGVRVAVMDTGIDYRHPDLGGSDGATFPTDRVVTGYDFVGDDFDASGATGGMTPVPDSDPMDCNGHGTHVAGIVGADEAAEGGVTGVAPDVVFGAYKVFGCTGSTTADVMIAAMERALDDEMDVLNMSIGSSFQWPQYPTSIAADRLVDEGMVVVASIGNSGANGLYSAGAPGLGKNVIGVASFDNTHINALSFVVNPSGERVPYLPLPSASEPPTSGETPEVVWAGRGCTSLGDTVSGVADRVALMIRGECTFEEKYAGAVAAGAVGVVIHNNVTGLFAGGGVIDRDVFGIGISLADGQHIRSLIDAGEPVTLSWSDVRIDSPNPTGGLISSFSSYGLSPDLDLKPDIGAPGGLIRSTYPLSLGGYATVSGTSMSSPHVAGGVALLLEAEPDIAAHDVRGRLQNTADPKMWWGNPGLGFLDNVHRQGAGMLDIPGAVGATATVTPSKLALGESESGPATRTLTIENRGDEALTYTMSHVAALSTGPNTFTPSFLTGFAVVGFGAPSVTVAAGSSVEVPVTITADAGLPDRSQYGGYLVATGDDGTVLRVPYAGFKGDYQSITTLTPTPFEFPWLAKLEGDTYKNQPDGATFSLKDGERPYILLHLDHQAQALRMEARDVRTGKLWGRGFELEYLPRNATATGFFAFDALISRGKGASTQGWPNGTYVIEVSVLKALGDRANPDHWETWTSPPITITRR